MSDESLLQFPCEIPIKVFGRNEQGFREAVLTILKKHFDRSEPSAMSERASSAGKYLSITVTVHAQTREQIDAAYRDLTAHADIMMVL